MTSAKMGDGEKEKEVDWIWWYKWEGEDDLGGQKWQVWNMENKNLCLDRRN